MWKEHRLRSHAVCSWNNNTDCLLRDRVIFALNPYYNSSLIARMYREIEMKLREVYIEINRENGVSWGLEGHVWGLS